jgi:glycosyltransferase involved in cell wall biosynthesis
MYITVTTPTLIHVLSLDTIGGVESLYVHFITEALSRGTGLHYTSVCGKPPHKKFLAHFEKLGYKPFLEEHIMGIRLPRILRTIVNLRRSMVEDIVKPTFWAFWNRIEEASPPGNAVYYEHGAAWNVPVSKKRMKFLSNCTAYIANSNAAATILKDKWQVKLPITVIPNPLRPDICVAESPKALSRTHPLSLGFIGRLVPVKGLFVALHTLKCLIDRGIPASLTIAGVGPVESQARHQARILGIDQYVLWKGCLECVSDFYDGIDILIVPSIREPLGLVALEASARGVPVVAAAVDGLPEAVLDGISGLCVSPSLTVLQAREMALATDPLPDLVVDAAANALLPPKILNPSHCADAIEKIINDTSLYTKLSSGGICHAKSRADFHSYFNALQNILECKQTDSTDGEDSSSPDC